jgi:signal transduction histidine kinase
MTTKLTELIENPELRAATAAALDATARGESLDRPRVPLPASDTRARLIARPLGALSLVYLRPMLVAAVDVDEVVTELELLRAENARLRQSMRERTADLVSNLEDLAERNAELDRFAHVAAHDLKAPVRAVLSFSEAIGEELDAGHPAHAYLDRVQAAAARMGQLVDSLLRFAASGRGELRIEDVDLEECLDAVRLDLRIEIEERSAEVVSAGLPAVRADPTAIRQLLQNLVANGLKFVDGAPPRVVVSAEIRAEDFVIRVEDNGVGFDPAYADEIFEPFRRLHSTRKFRGSGVGLSICRRIIQRHGGAIWAHSEPGRGASFLFTLPRAA